MPRIGELARRLLPTGELERIRGLALADAGHGFDELGVHADWVAFGAGLLGPLYDRWFRVTSHGAEHLPRSGAVILASNHSGALPFDATMIWLDVLRHTDPPRVVRAVVDHFVPAMPFVGTFFARTGCVGGSRGNVRRLLDNGEVLLIFPEGTAGVGKLFRDRYHLATWRVGHAELALRHRVPIVPVAVIGAEEQMPQLGRIELGARLVGAPYIPLVATPLPLPVHYHLWYGEPLLLADRFPPARADEPEVLELAAEEVAQRVRALITRGLRGRRGIFA